MTGRRRGRPAGGGGGGREAILAAARSMFAAKGYAATSMRAVAAEAGVNAALISHYFGDKAGLLVATMDLPVDPIEKVATVVEGGATGLGERLVRTFLETWDPHRDAFSTLYRTALTGEEGGGGSSSPLVQLAQSVLIKSLSEVIEGPDRDTRAALVASELLGLATARYVARLAGVAEAPVGKVVAIYGPSVQQLVDR